MKDKIIFIIVLLLGIALMHSGKPPKLDTSKMTAQEKNMMSFGLAAGM